MKNLFRQAAAPAAGRQQNGQAGSVQSKRSIQALHPETHPWYLQALWQAGRTPRQAEPRQKSNGSRTHPGSPPRQNPGR